MSTIQPFDTKYFLIENEIIYHFKPHLIFKSMNYQKEWVPLNQREKLTLPHIMGIAAGTLVATLLWAIVFTLFSPLCTKLQLSSITKTLLLLYGSLVGFIFTPILGVYSDGLMLKWGRRRIFMIIGGILLVCGMLVMMYCVEIGNLFGKTDPMKISRIVFILSLILVFTAGNVIQSPARTLCSDVTPPKQQILMANICQVYGGVGGILTNLVGGFELYKYTQLEQEQFILIVCLSISFVAMIVAIVVTPEEPLKEKPPKINPFSQIWFAFKNMPKPFIRILAPFSLGCVAIYQFGFQFSHFMGHDLYNGNNDINASSEDKINYQKGVSWSMMCNAVNSAVQFIYGFMNTKVCEKIGMKYTMIFGLALLSLGFFLFFFVDNRFGYLAIAAPIGIGSVIYMAVPYTIVSLVIPTEELGANLGILNMFSVVGQQVSNFGIGNGFGALWPNDSRKMIGISSVFGLIGAILGFWIISPEIIDLYGPYSQIPERSTNELSTASISDY
ncbi:major facilitator superfamily transporter [Tritrichomonas foetus]|uniref:Major facilitator superfamily transporter n=1 Tax=Tritrichomonas foetus TaxID=1144522 RepID=A0A1J4KER6_9EUKA|nr:major facilitator superfamily transporter [Tritrichomonas foetus]|eukprot:OHT08252.1 major facilitator superfamily transporter [Tritrichomonas foetus]